MIGDTLKTALSTTFSGRVHPDVGPFNATQPFAIYQQIGGRAVVTFCGENNVNRMYQLTVWADSRREADSKMEAASLILTSPPYLGIPQGGALGRYDEMTKTYGSMRDFSFWS